LSRLSRWSRQTRVVTLFIWSSFFPPKPPSRRFAKAIYSVFNIPFVVSSVRDESILTLFRQKGRPFDNGYVLIPFPPQEENVQDPDIPFEVSLLGIVTHFDPSSNFLRSYHLYLRSESIFPQLETPPGHCRYSPAKVFYEQIWCGFRRVTASPRALGLFSRSIFSSSPGDMRKDFLQEDSLSGHPWVFLPSFPSIHRPSLPLSLLIVRLQD